MKRIINLKMNEFSPLNTKNKNFMGNDSFILSNSFSGGFPHIQSRETTSLNAGLGENPMQIPPELSVISPIDGITGYIAQNNLNEDSLYKPSMREMSGGMPDLSQPSIGHPGANPSLFGISL
jgi:hypothetical protein